VDLPITTGDKQLTFDTINSEHAEVINNHSNSGRSILKPESNMSKNLIT